MNCGTHTRWRAACTATTVRSVDPKTRSLDRAAGAFAILLFAGLLAACDDDTEGSDASARDGSNGRADASEDARAPFGDADVPDAMPDATATEGESERCDRFDAPFDRKADSGAVVARFMSIDPVLEYKGYYDWILELRDGSGKAIGDAELEADAEMPSHGHGTTPIGLRHEPGSSRYELRDVNLFMAGKWEVSVTVRSNGGRDRVIFRACPRDPPDAGDEGEDGGAPGRRH